MARGPGRRDTSVHSVDRAVSILQVLARRGGAGVTEIAGELDVHKSTVSRLLGTLEARGMVEQTASRGRYRLAHGVVQLAAGATAKQDLSRSSRAICHDLAEEVGETVNIAINEGGAVVSIDQVMGSSTVTTINWVGRRSPLHATSAGKVFLAHLPPEELAVALSGRLERFTDRTVVDVATLADQLDVVRRQGYATTLDEQEVGLAAVAAPVRALDGQVIAALAVSGPSFRLDADAVPTVAAAVVAAADRIAERNGFPKPG